MLDTNIMDERVQELEAQRKELERQRKQNRDELRLAKSKQKKPMSYYIKNTLIILGILGYLYIMYGPYDLKQKLALWVKPKNVDPKNFQNQGRLFLQMYYHDYQNRPSRRVKWHYL